MTGPAVPNPSPRREAADEASNDSPFPTGWDAGRWDDAVEAASGHFLQSARWGAFKQRHGWSVERVVEGPSGHDALAQVLFKERRPFSIAYMPRGPVGVPDLVTARSIFQRVDDLCRARRALFLIVEPEHPLPFSGTYRQEGFVRGPEHIQPARTVKVPLLDDEALLNQMHQKTRYNIRLAQRRGVVIETGAANTADIDRFYRLLLDTSSRNEFGVHSRQYYDDFLSIFGTSAALLFARVDGNDAAGLIAARFGEQAIYMYGASSTEHRAHGAGFYLQFAAMQWAREQGCTEYDLWGIPRVDPVSVQLEDGHGLAGTKGDDWRGLYEFKVRFGGRIVDAVPTLERRYHPVLAAVARSVYHLGG